ncbi:hypothetical protein STRTUCAR8_09349 [Streptomyces turgidiscabies Car8]|uniref:Uncharacterized protein n=1 Tax=Streptomyces turgidiscabies (strain Car8) TaxID=698760 RepID=L7F6Q6_STRT8|nr:hypothetical protein STRTUCAR8_09349 [Streptomyces turgidiscabies Car8]
MGYRRGRGAAGPDVTAPVPLDNPVGHWRPAASTAAGRNALLTERNLIALDRNRPQALDWRLTADSPVVDARAIP